jgi:hypothetical protein
MRRVNRKKSRLKKKQQDDVPAASEYDVSVGIDPGLRYLFIGKSNKNADSKKRNSQNELQAVLP